MRIPMPRLVKDSKTAIWFFRWSLPKHLQQTHSHHQMGITQCEQQHHLQVEWTQERRQHALHLP